MSSSSRLARERRTFTCFLLVLAFALSSILTGCLGSDDDDGSSQAVPERAAGTEEASQEEVAEVTWAFPGSAIPTVAQTAPNFLAAISIQMNVEEGLLSYGSDGALKPGIAESWEQTSPTVYEYKLDPDRRFSDGSPVTMEDVIYSFETAADTEKGSWLSSFFTNVESFEDAGEDTLRVTLKRPDVDWQYVPGHLVSLIHQKATAVETRSTPAKPRGIQIGSGPYMVEDIASDSITLARNPHYAGEVKPTVETIVVRFIPDDATRLAAIQAGDIDGTFLVPLTSTPEWEQVDTINVLSVPTHTYLNMGFNHRKAPFDDAHARRAVMWAFNREAIVERVLNGNARAANTLLPPELWQGAGLSAEDVEARSDELGTDYTFDLEKAKEELAQSKTPDGFSATVIYSNTLTEAGLGMQVLAQDLKKIGVDLRLREVSDAQLAETTEARKHDIYISAGGADWPDPLSLMEYSYQDPPNGGSSSGYKNPELVKLMSEAAANQDQEERANQLFEGLAIGSEDLPWPTIWWHNAVVGVSKELVLTDFGPWTMLQTPWMANVRAAASE